VHDGDSRIGSPPAWVTPSQPPGAERFLPRAAEANRSRRDRPLLARSRWDPCAVHERLWIACLTWPDLLKSAGHQHPASHGFGGNVSETSANYLEESDALPEDAAAPL